MQNESADVELQIFGSQGRAEVRKRNIRSLEVKAEQKCGSGSAEAALQILDSPVKLEADLNIFDRPISYWSSLLMLKNNSTDCYI